MGKIKLLTKVDIKNFDDNAPKIKTRKGVERSFIRRKITEYEKKHGILKKPNKTKQNANKKIKKTNN